MNKKINDIGLMVTSNEVTSTDGKRVTVYKAKLSNIFIQRRNCVVLTVFDTDKPSKPSVRIPAAVVKGDAVTLECVTTSLGTLTNINTIIFCCLA